MIAYQTAWLKYHYPVIYGSFNDQCYGVLTVKVAGYIQYCRKEKGIECFSPDGNESYANFSVVGDKIRFRIGCCEKCMIITNID